MDSIKIRGARVHNLKNISVEIPRDKLVVITRVLGSLKDSVFAASRPALLQINFVVTP